MFSQAENRVERPKHTHAHTPSGWKQASRKHSTPSADWHVESASNVLSVSFVKLISITVSHSACACIHRCVNITSIPTNMHMNTRSLSRWEHCLNFVKMPSFIKSTGRRKKKSYYFRFDNQFNESYNVYLGDLNIDLYCIGMKAVVLLCFVLVLWFHAMSVTFFPGEWKRMEQEAEGECLLLQSQSLGERGAEIVLSVRIRSWLQLLVCC